MPQLAEISDHHCGGLLSHYSLFLSLMDTGSAIRSNYSRPYAPAQKRSSLEQRSLYFKSGTVEWRSKSGVRQADGFVGQ